jgi:hypothetical protein
VSNESHVALIDWSETVNINKQKYMGNMGNRITQTENRNIKNIGELQVNSKSDSKTKVLLITAYLSHE